MIWFRWKLECNVNLTQSEFSEKKRKKNPKILFSVHYFGRFVWYFVCTQLWDERIIFSVAIIFLPINIADNVFSIRLVQFQLSWVFHTRKILTYCGSLYTTSSTNVKASTHFVRNEWKLGTVQNGKKITHRIFNF